MSTRVTRRSEAWGPEGSNRLLTSEFFQQLFTTPSSPQPRIKASQCATKYLWRSVTDTTAASEAAAAAPEPATARSGSSGDGSIAAPQIVATQARRLGNDLRVLLVPTHIPP